jgi:hypothetical protein
MPAIFPLLFANWRVIVLGIAVMAVAGYVLHCEHVKSELAASIAIAKQQEVENAKKALRDIKKKELADENYENRIARLNASLKRLRDSGGSLTPAAPAGAEHPDRITFDRALFDRALRDYEGAVQGLLGEGAAAVEGLDTAKSWVKGRE